MNLIEELEDLLSLAEHDERYAIRECIDKVKKAQDIRQRWEAQDLPDMEDVRLEYEQYVEDGIDPRAWPARVHNYVAYQKHGNVNGGGGDAPGKNRPVILAEPEDYGFAKAYPLSDGSIDVQH